MPELGRPGRAPRGSGPRLLGAARSGAQAMSPRRRRAMRLVATLASGPRQLKRGPRVVHALRRSGRPQAGLAEAARRTGDEPEVVSGRRLRDARAAAAPRRSGVRPPRRRARAAGVSRVAPRWSGAVDESSGRVGPARGPMARCAGRRAGGGPARGRARTETAEWVIDAVSAMRMASSAVDSPFANRPARRGSARAKRGRSPPGGRRAPDAHGRVPAGAFTDSREGNRAARE